MRISDWSSDVCSSDKMTSANTPISDAKALELQRILVLQEMQDEIISWAKKRFAMLGLAAAVLGFFGLSTVLNQSLQILVTKPRSEEHTSELQSLMRISYAVFCLKKKKTKVLH